MASAQPRQGPGDPAPPRPPPVALVVAVAVLAVGVGAVSPRRGPRPFTPFGRPIVAIPEVAAQALGVPVDQVAAAIQAGVPAWGEDFLGREVFRIADLEQALGWPEPDRRRGAPWRGRPILGTRGARTGRRRSPEGTSLPEGSGGLENGLSAASWPLGELEEG